jgi:flagellar biosynthesis/type III secretory pathway protein FliH
VSAIIKSTSAKRSGTILSLEDARRGDAASLAITTLEDQLRQKITTLEAINRRQQEQIEILHKDVQQAFVEGEAQGKEVGLAAAEDRQAERFGVLKGGVQKALTSFEESMSSLERLALLIARDCVNVMMTASEARADLLCDMIRFQASKIEKSSIIAIEVSGQDFPTERDLIVLAERAFTGPVELSVGKELEAGDCVIRLRLGQLEIGINQQWGVLGDLLEEMARPEDGS